MRRILCLLIVLLLIGSTGLSESIDLSVMTDDELLELKDRVLSEIEIRNDGSTNVGPWYDYGLGSRLPSFEDATENANTVKGICWNDDNSFGEQFEGVTREDFERYCEALDQWGYNIGKATTNASYSASNADGIMLEVYLLSDLMTVKADK